MEVKCDGCGEYFPRSELKVSQKGGVYCFTKDNNFCSPKYAEPIRIDVSFSWASLVSLVDYLNGDTGLETLMAIKIQLEKVIYQTLKRVLKDEESLDGSQIQKSDP